MTDTPDSTPGERAVPTAPQGRPGPERPPSRIRLGAKGILVGDGEALLVRERRADGSTFWTLPGGGIEPEESLAACLRREIAEELQCRCVVGEPITTCRYRHSSDEGLESLYVVLSGRLDGHPVPARDQGVLDVRWVTPTDPPPGTLPPFQRLLRRIAADGDDGLTCSPDGRARDRS
jgi:8-oxo-dGTP pyrophosphatase MutT (NUDIX family)